MTAVRRGGAAALLLAGLEVAFGLAAVWALIKAGDALDLFDDDADEFMLLSCDGRQPRGWRDDP